MGPQHGLAGSSDDFKASSARQKESSFDNARGRGSLDVGDRAGYRGINSKTGAQQKLPGALFTYSLVVLPLN